VNRLAIMLTSTLAALALPASALAASSSGTVLSVDRSDHVVAVVDSSHVVHAYRYRRLANVKDGTRIRFKMTGSSIADVTSLGRAPTVSFYAKVVRSGAHGLVLRLGDGSEVTLGPRRLAHTHTSAPRIARPPQAGRASTAAAAGVTINIEGLQPGETVLVTESTDAQGNPIITIELTGTPRGGTVSEQQLSGAVTDLEDDTFQVTTADGSVLNLHMAQDTLANLNLSYCDQVTVSYHEDGGIFIADSVRDSGPSTSAGCAGDSSSGEGQGDGQDATGAITSVSGGSVTIDQGGGQGTLTFTVDDPALTDGFAVGDVVDVTYAQLSDGSLDASDVEYVENDATGVVTAVSAGAVTFTDDDTGNPDTFTADPSTGTFDGVLVGDELDITYHVGAAGDVIDNVDDSGPQGS
jgi:hypothetical protein